MPLFLVMCFKLHIVLQLAVVTEERNKLRNFANLKNDETLDASKNANSVQVAVALPSILLSYNLLCDLLMFLCLFV